MNNQTQGMNTQVDEHLVWIPVFVISGEILQIESVFSFFVIFFFPNKKEGILYKASFEVRENVKHILRSFNISAFRRKKQTPVISAQFKICAYPPHLYFVQKNPNGTTYNLNLEVKAHI